MSNKNDKLLVARVVLLCTTQICHNFWTDGGDISVLKFMNMLYFIVSDTYSRVICLALILQMKWKDFCSSTVNSKPIKSQVSIRRQFCFMNDRTSFVRIIYIYYMYEILISGRSITLVT